jgi:hypothetical protein
MSHKKQESSPPSTPGAATVLHSDHSSCLCSCVASWFELQMATRAQVIISTRRLPTLPGRSPRSTAATSNLDFMGKDVRHRIARSYMRGRLKAALTAPVAYSLWLGIYEPLCA